MTRLLHGDIPPGGKCDIKTLARASGVDRTAFYGSRPYAHLRDRVRAAARALLQAGEQPDPRDAQVARLKDEITRLKERLARSDATIGELTAFRDQALARLAVQHHEITRLRQEVRLAAGIAGCRPPPRSSACHDHRPPQEPGLADAVRAGAAGLYSLEAACDLVIGTGWLHRDDFSSFVSTVTSITDGVTELAHVDWHAVIASRDSGLLPWAAQRTGS